ncbi:hypothetical protein SE16_12835 [Ardenticatena maritima]|uniref:Glycosyltransferase RgtA/B/C/D-like domain-containing protein n=2 Tax=Ardenticatena maritima TaxID=872965 RepID=A0A0P6YNZ0_9CHLR|nr:hypothetical protein SE16_12835 [Ardenticatena maritima]
MSLAARVERWAWRLLLVLLLAAAALFLVHVWLAVRADAPLDYGEGPLLNQARLLVQGRPLYRPTLDEPPYTITNYPPLYQMLVALVGAVVGFTYATGRWVSAAASLAAAGAVWALVQALTGDRRAGALAGALFLAFPIVFYWGVLGRVDMLALALSLWGIWWAVRWPQAWRGVIGAAVLLTAAAFTRQSYLLAAPLAVLCWLAAHERRWAVRFVALFALLVAGLGALAVWWTDGGFWLHVVVANRNRLEWWRLLLGVYMLLLFAAPLAVITLVEVPRHVRHVRRRQARSWLLLGYFVGASLSALTIAKVGSNVNYLLEWCAASVLLVGVGVVRWQREMTPTARLLPLGLLIAGLGLALWEDTTFLETTSWAAHELASEVEQLEALVCAAEGPVLADDMMSVLVVCGKEIYLQPFEYTHLVEDGVWDQQPLLDAIRAQQFALILMSDTAWHGLDRHWTPEMEAAIREAYTPAERLAGTLVYHPKSRTP